MALAAKPPKVPKPPAYTSGLGGTQGYNLLNPPSSGGSVPSSAPSVPGYDFGDLTPKYDPNAYLGELTSDPMYQGAGAAFDRAIGSGRQALADQIRQLVIRGGWDLRSQMPGGLSKYAGDVDPATLAAASSNPLSARAQLEQQLNQGRGDLTYGLAGRGIGNSGAFATGNTALQNAYDTQTYGAQNQLLDAIGQGASNFASLSAQAEAARNAAYEAAASRLAQRPGVIQSATPGGYSLSDIARLLPRDTNNQLANAILSTPGFDYQGLSNALGVPTYEDIRRQLPASMR